MHAGPADDCGPATPRSPCESHGLGSSDFARHYFRNHGCFLFLGVLRWFTSPRLPVHPMDSDARKECSHSLGFPIRKSPDHSLLAASRGLSQLTTSFFAYLRQGIHTHALSSLTIKSTSHTRPLPPAYSPVLRPICERYFLCAYYLCLIIGCRSSGRPAEQRGRSSINARQIFSCQRSRLLQQPVEREFNELLPEG